MIEAKEPLSITRQCELVEVSRSGYYYRARGESQRNQALMRRIDELHSDYPTWGSRMLRDRLRIEGQEINRKRIQRLMGVMGITTIYAKRNLSRRNHEQKVYPYLLRGLVIEGANQVWSTDVTYIRLAHGFVYLTAVIDWYSRAILSWRVSNTCDRFFCIEAVAEALDRYGAPQIFNTDQGSTFTPEEFSAPLVQRGVRMSMDGKGRALDNVRIERFWRTLKHEEVYLKEYESVADARRQIGTFIETYNRFRPHSANGGRPPMEVYAA
jgi:putative transposase